MKMPHRDTNQITADQTHKIIIPKVRYHPSIQIQTPRARSGTSQTQKSRPAVRSPPRTEIADQTHKIIIPKVRYHPSIQIQTPRARSGTSQTQKPRPAVRSPPRTEIVDQTQKIIIPKVRYHPSIQSQTPRARSGTSQTQKSRPSVRSPPRTEIDRRTVQEIQNASKASPVNPGSAVKPHPDGGVQQKPDVPGSDRAPPRPEQVPLGLGIQLDRCVVEDVEVLTHGQSKNPDWFRWRKNRITASVAHRIVHCRFTNGKSKVPPRSYVAAITGGGCSIQTRAMSWGIRMERKVVCQYQRLKSAALGRSVSVEDCGLFIDPLRPWLAASPDGIVRDSRTKQRLVCLEVKCPYKHRNRRVEDACRNDPAFCLKIQDEDRDESRGSPVYCLKSSHSYYTQIQVQLAVTGLQQADLVVFTLKELAIVPVAFDPDLWAETVSKLEMFYRNAILPHLREKAEQDSAASWTTEL